MSGWGVSGWGRAVHEWVGEGHVSEWVGEGRVG